MGLQGPNTITMYPLICVLGPLGFTAIGLQGHRVMGLRIWDVGG